MWQDIHVMTYIGFGFLLVFLKNNSWTAIGFTYLLAAWAFQWAILVVSFWDMVFTDFDRIHLSVKSMVMGDYAAVACMIMFGALAGKASLMHMFWMTTFCVIFYGLNQAICLIAIRAQDIGGCITIHTFGGFFGLAASYWFSRREAIKDEDKKHGGNYTSNLVAMFGTLFLYLFYPSFNAAYAPVENQQRIVVNTTFAMTGSLVAAAFWSRVLHSKLDMTIMLNATLAGGIMIGASADFIMGSGGSIIIGFLAGLISAISFAHFGPWLKKTIGLSDTRGVLSLHALPGFFGGIISGICGAFANRYLVDDRVIANIFPDVANGQQDFSTQGGNQIAALVITVGIAICGGIISAMITTNLPGGDAVKHCFDDGEHWHNVVEDAPADEAPAHAEPVKGSYWSANKAE